MTHDQPATRLFLVTSGWEGPFQFEQVLVGAHDIDDARTAAERAFGEVAQPVCRAKMRIAELGSARHGLIAGPSRNGQPLAAGGPTEARCGVDIAAGPADDQTPGP